mmetsp:Transcript_37703/g.33724  ORF Transcript_37703/g.33724 Transcript_37703/m.33724 type:complete len:184 (+) Transcript_37703:4119-4670(+)
MGVNLPNMMPEHQYLKHLEPLGWIHSQSSENFQLSPQDITQHAKFIGKESSWTAERCIVITTSFTPGSVSLSAYKINQQGYEWGKNNKDTSPNPPGYNDSLYEKVQLILVDSFMGFFMVPDNKMWNYTFTGLGLEPNLKYSLVLDNPKEFYADIHRTSHFIKFTNKEEASEEIDMADKEDLFG